MIDFVADLQRDLEILTCTCKRRAGYVNNFYYDNGLKHQQCNKPQQDRVIYQCADCQEYFFSDKLQPMRNRPWTLYSVIYIARAMSKPNMTDEEKFSVMGKIGDVFCDECNDY